MPELSCPACGTHLELGLTAVTSTGQEKVDSPAVAGTPNRGTAGTVEPRSQRCLLKGEAITVDPQKLIEIALRDVNRATSATQWVCIWVYEDLTGEVPFPVRAVLMAYLEAEYPTVDWTNLGVTTNDAVRIISKFMGFSIVNLRNNEVSMPDFRTLYKKPDGLAIGSMQMSNVKIQSDFYTEGPDAENII